MIEFHAITSNGRELVAQVVNGELIIPPVPAAQPNPGTAAPPPGK